MAINQGQRISAVDGARPYMVFESTLAECVRELLAKPISQQHLYDVATDPQPAFDQAALTTPDVTEIAARADFP